MLKETVAVTVLVVMGKVVDADPAGTVTLAGTVAAALALESVTTAPPAGAIPVSVTVPVEEAPPFTVAGLRVSEDAAGGAMARGAAAVAPPPVAEILAVVDAATP
jgi:hypothetical protein